MKKIFILATMVLISFTAQAQNYPKEAAARVVADLMNTSGTYDKLISTASGGLTTDEATGVAHFFKSRFKDEDLKATIPTATAVGSKVTFANSNLVLEFNDNGSFNIAGKVYSSPKGPIDIYMQNNFSNSSQKTGIMNFIIPQAQAFIEVPVGAALLIDAATLAAVVGGIPYVISQIWQRAVSAGISCSSSGQFIVTTPTHGFFSQKDTIPMDKASVLLKKPISECTKDDAKALHDVLVAHQRSASQKSSANGTGTN